MSAREKRTDRGHRPVRLRGALGTFPLWEVLQWLAAHEEEGVLEIGTAPGRPPGAWIHCGAGRVLAVSAGPRAARLPLGEHLVREGLLSRPQLRLALALQERIPAPRRRLGQWLLACQALAPGSLQPALRAQGRARLQRLLARRRGWFRFRPGPPAETGLPVEETIEALLLRGAHRLDEAGS